MYIKDNEEYVLNLYEILKLLLNGIAENTGRLVTEEREIFRFIEDLSRECKYFSVQFKFLFNLMVYDPKRVPVIKEALLIVKKTIREYDLSNELLSEVIPELYKRMEDLMALRLVKEVVLQNEEDPIWCSIGKYFVAISAHFINPELYKEDSELQNSDKEENKSPEVKITTSYRNKEVKPVV